MDPVAQSMAEYGWVAVIIYIVVRELLAVARKWLPENTKRAAAKEDREATCREREAEALEKIASALVTTNERLGIQERMSERFMQALEIANQGIVVLLDRKKGQKKLDPALSD